MEGRKRDGAHRAEQDRRKLRDGSVGVRRDDLWNQELSGLGALKCLAVGIRRAACQRGSGRVFGVTTSEPAQASDVRARRLKLYQSELE
jgi:hypothetical protein